MAGREHRLTEADEFRELEAQRELLGKIVARLTAGREDLASTIQDIEQRVAALAERQDVRFAELRQAIDHAELERRHAEEQARADGESAAVRANEALVRGHEAVRRIDALAAAVRRSDASTVEVMSGLAGDWDVLRGSVRELRQRIVSVAARQDAQLAELRQVLDHMERERRQAESDARAGSARTTARAEEALARGDEAMRRVDALAKASQLGVTSIEDAVPRVASRAEPTAAQGRPAPRSEDAAAASTGERATERSAGHRDAEPPPTNERYDAGMSWLVLTAPGILLTQAVLALALIAGPWFVEALDVAPGVRLSVGALLVVHCVTTLLVLRRGGQRPVAALFLAMLVVDALGAGVVLGADWQLRSPAISICMVVVAVSLMAAGWAAALASVVATAAGVGVAMHAGIAAPLVRAATLWFNTTLAVETSFANTPVLAMPVVSFPTTLSVETLYAGQSVLGVGPSAPLFLPALVIAFVAVGFGAGVNVGRSRKARAAMAAGLAAAHRSMVHG